jgi:hypothetical protein
VSLCIARAARMPVGMPVASSSCRARPPEVISTHDRVPPINRFGLMPDHRHGDAARDASAFQVPYCRAMEIMGNPAGVAGFATGRPPGLPKSTDPRPIGPMKQPGCDDPLTLQGARGL